MAKTKKEKKETTIKKDKSKDKKVEIVKEPKKIRGYTTGDEGEIFWSIS